MVLQHRNPTNDFSFLWQLLHFFFVRHALMENYQGKVLYLRAFKENAGQILLILT